MLTGSYLRSFDDKQRFSLPKGIRDALGQLPLVLYLTPGTDGSLALYNEEAFQRLATQLQQGAPNSQHKRAFERLFYAQAQRIEVDRQGRIRVPQPLARLARLEDEVMLIGVGDHLEVWNSSLWQSYLEQQQSRYDEIAERAFGGPAAPAEGRSPAAKATGLETGPREADERRPAQPR